MAYIMAPKEESEVNIVKKACQGTMDLFSKFLKEQIMDIVDKDKASINSSVIDSVLLLHFKSAALTDTWGSFSISMHLNDQLQLNTYMFSQLEGMLILISIS